MYIELIVYCYFDNKFKKDKKKEDKEWENKKREILRKVQNKERE